MSWARIEHPRPYVEQWQRVLRWQRRLHTIVSEHYDDADAVVDHALALLQNCFCMRDWLSRSLPSKETEIQNLFSSRALSLCRDLANGSKHLAIDRPSVDARHSVHASYVPPPLDGSSSSSYELVLAAGGDMIPFLDLCATCVQELQRFLVAENLLPANLATRAAGT